VALARHDNEDKGEEGGERSRRRRRKEEEEGFRRLTPVLLTPLDKGPFPYDVITIPFL